MTYIISILITVIKKALSIFLALSIFDTLLVIFLAYRAYRQDKEEYIDD